MSGTDNERRQSLEAQIREASINRRSLVKGAAAGAAGAAAIGGAARFGAPRAAAAPMVVQEGEEQVLYNFILQDEPLSFDWNANLYCQAEVETFAGVLTFDPDGAVVPDWAESHSSNDDASVWTFNIRPNNTGWSNGDPVTAQDFVWSWARLLSPNPVGASGPNSYNFILYDVLNAEPFSAGTAVEKEGDPLNGEVPTEADLGLKAVDDWTLEVTLEGPRANFPQKCAYLACYPAHRPSVEEHGEQWALGDVPLVSNGPLKLDQWEKGVRCVLSKNENYWNAESMSLTKVIDPIVPSDNLVFTYESGTGDEQLDWTNVPAADLPRFQEDPELSQQLQQYVYPGIWMLVPSNGIPPFDDLKVRQAVSHAIDRERLKTLTKDLVQPAQVMVPLGIYGYFDDPEINEIQKFDPALAMEALVGTEFEGGQNWPEITIHYRGQESVYNSDLMVTDIAEQLKENLGMDIQLEVIPENTWRPSLYENSWQLVWIRWWLDYPDPDNCYYDMYYGKKTQKRQAWGNEEFDRLCIEAKEEQDPDARLELYKQAERIIQEDVGYIPVVYRVDQYAYKPWVKDVPVNKQGLTTPDGNIFVRMLTSVRIEGREES